GSLPFGFAQGFGPAALKQNRFGISERCPSVAVVGLIPITQSSLDLRDPSVGRVFLELKGVVAGNNAVGRAGELDHPLLVLDVGGAIGLRESGAGFVFRKIAIEIAIVGGQNERRTPFDAQVL